MKTDETAYIGKWFIYTIFTPVKKSAHAVRVYSWEWSVKQTKGAVLVRKGKRGDLSGKQNTTSPNTQTITMIITLSGIFDSTRVTPQNQGLSSSRSFSIY